MPRRLTLLVVGLTLVTVNAFAEFPVQIDGMPDFCQTDKEGRFYDGGRKFCGPVAASNSIMWLAQRGYPQLIDRNESDKAVQIELIRTLGSPSHMKTEGNDGTGPLRFMQGLHAYVTDRGGKIERLEYQGWVPVPREFNPTRSRPTLDWMCRAVELPGGMACINVGWYTHDEATDTYTRHGGHWMTVVGGGVDQDGNQDDSILLLHDPAPRSGKGKVTHYSRVEELTDGKLVGTKRGLPNQAKDLFVIRNGIINKQVVKGKSTHPIIDGAVVMVLE